jgi:hypothetical protein
MSKLPLMNELKTIVSPSGEKLAKPSMEAVLSALLDPGRLSMFTGVVQSPQFLATAAEPMAMATAVPARAVGQTRLKLILFMTSLAQLQMDEQA